MHPLLGTSDRRVRQMILNGQLSAKKIGRALTLSRSDVKMLRFLYLLALQVLCVAEPFPLAVVSSKRHHSYFAQFLQQSLGVLQIRRVEAFGEPVVNLCERLTRFGCLALLSPLSREAHRGAQL